MTNKAYLRLRIHVQIDISTFDPAENIESILCDDGHPLLQEIDAAVAEQVNLGAYQVDDWKVSDFTAPFYKDPT